MMYHKDPRISDTQKIAHHPKILTTVKLFNFTSYLFMRYSQGREFHKNKSPQKFSTSIITNQTSQRNAKINRHDMTFHQQKK